MTDTERALLENLLDAFDRLYDRECGVADTEALLQATAIAIAGSAFVPKIEDARSGLSAILRSGASAVDQNLAALAATDALRRDLAEVLGY
jgi:hypothetical protein